MPMPAKGARILERRRKGRDPVFVIKDTGGVEISTGSSCREEAEIALAKYITRRGGPNAPDEMTVADVLAIYAEEHGPNVASPRTLGLCIEALIPFWGQRVVSDVKGATCRAYCKSRRHHRTGAPIKNGTLRRELNALQAAMNYCFSEGQLTMPMKVTLPKADETNQRALTRDEVAQLLWAARRCGRRRKDRDYVHIMHFILVSIYSGTRASPTLNLRLTGPATTGGWFDLDRGNLYRIGTGERVTKKRRTPARIPRQLRAHVARWIAKGDTWAVQWQGGRVADIKTAWASVVKEAKLGWRPTPHTLKHTAITWAIQGGSSIADAASFFATSAQTIERVYWHMSPDFQTGAVSAIEGVRR